MTDSFHKVIVANWDKLSADVNIADRLAEGEYQEALDILLGQIVKGERRRGRMVCIQEGVMEIDDLESFEAAIQTEEGPKTIQGNLCNLRTPNASTPQQPPSRWTNAIGEIEFAIRDAHATLQPNEAIGAISSVWSELDRVGELAAARTQILLRQVALPPLGPCPDWFNERAASILSDPEGNQALIKRALATAELLVRATISHDDAPELRADVDVGPLGRVIIDWHIPGSRLQWMVEAIELPWPSVKVYQLAYGKRSSAPQNLAATVAHNAFDVLEFFSRHRAVE